MVWHPHEVSDRESVAVFYRRQSAVFYMRRFEIGFVFEARLEGDWILETNEHRLFTANTHNEHVLVAVITTGISQAFFPRLDIP
jgi:hypothetical protein